MKRTNNRSGKVILVMLLIHCLNGNRYVLVPLFGERDLTSFFEFLAKEFFKCTVNKFYMLLDDFSGIID